jgi:hypothetical protein
VVTIILVVVLVATVLLWVEITLVIPPKVIARQEWVISQVLEQEPSPDVLKRLSRANSREREVVTLISVGLLLSALVVIVILALHYTTGIPKW